MTTTSNGTYDLRGDVIEACSCRAICPCCVAEDPDGETCDNLTGYHIRSGVINGVDVTGLTVVSVVHIPGNLFDGNWREVLLVDDKATGRQSTALAEAFQGNLGGPLAEIAALVGERVGVRQVPISFAVTGGTGRIRIGTPSGAGPAVDIEMEPFTGADGEPIRLLNSVVPGAVAVAGRARHNRVDLADDGMRWSFEARNAVNGLGFHLTNTPAGRR